MLVKLWRRIRPQLTIKRVIEIAIAVIGVVSAYVGMLGFWMPRISVQPLEASDPKDALSSAFVVTNQGAMDIYDVGLGCRFINFKVMHYAEGIVFSKRDANESKEPEIGEVSDMVAVPGYEKIAPMKSATMEFPFSAPGEENVDVEVVIYYRPAWYPFGRRDAFRFVTKAGADKQLHWLPRPDSTSDPKSPPP